MAFSAAGDSLCTGDEILFYGGGTIPTDFSAWHLPAGCYYRAEEVSSDRDSEISAKGQPAADGRLPLHLPATSVVLLALDPIGLGRSVSALIPRPPAADLAR